MIVKSAKDLAAILAENPFAVDAAQHSRFLVAFAPDREALSGLAAIEPLVQLPGAVLDRSPRGVSSLR